MAETLIAEESADVATKEQLEKDIQNRFLPKEPTDTPALETDPDKRALAQMQALAQINPSLAKDTEFTKIFEDLKTKVNGKPAEKAAAAASAKVGPDEEEDDEEEKEKVKSKLYSKGITKKEAPVVLPFLNTPEITKLAKDVFGLEDPQKLISSAKKWKQDSIKLPELQQAIEEQEEFYATLPDPIKIAIKKWSENDDAWDEAMVKAVQNRIDYNKNFSKQDAKSMIGHYFPDHGYAEGELVKAIKDGDDPVINRFVKSAEILFNKEKEDLKAQTDKVVEQQKAGQKVFAENLSKAAEQFTTDYPDADKSTVKKIETILRKGDIFGIYYNKDGTPKPDAYKRLFMTLEGESEVNIAMGRAKVNGANDAIAQMVSRGHDKLPVDGGAKPVLTEESLKKSFNFINDDSNPYNKMFAGNPK